MNPLKTLLCSLCLQVPALTFAAEPVRNLLALGAEALVVQSPPAYDG